MNVYKLTNGDKGLIACSESYDPFERVRGNQLEKVNIDELIKNPTYELTSFLDTTKYIADDDDGVLVAFSTNLNHIDVSRLLRFDPCHAGFITEEGQTYGSSFTLGGLKSHKNIIPEFEVFASNIK